MMLNNSIMILRFSPQINWIVLTALLAKGENFRPLPFQQGQQVHYHQNPQNRTFQLLLKNPQRLCTIRSQGKDKGSQVHLELYCVLSSSPNFNEKCSLILWRLSVPIWKINFCSSVLRLSKLPRCKERPQTAICCSEWLGRLKCLATGLDVS